MIFDIIEFNGRTTIKTGTYEVTVSALLILAMEWIKKVRIQTQEKYTIGFGQTATCIDLRPVALDKEYWYDYKMRKNPPIR